ncbi:nitroreductase family protein [Clostridium sp. 'White wine YQ']|uniref:nitroreductase family protein n=1 Tax=Clostridium sp. 'White wine YQ' TaxID=3027474 RepID=UPI002365B3A9|nr:nitroreductase family protein [Clostridium sp. 'White wine YQ']MDD7795441.1 nitroreductase family protein [Clostridium sp. 'White wine YQ']
MNIIEAIYKRKSIRKYVPYNISQSDFGEVENLVKNLQSLYSEIQMKITLIKEGIKIQEISKGIIGSYGKIEAPHYMVITSEEKEGYLENIGYTLEQLVLELADRGIGTCYIGGSIKKELLKDIMEIPSNQKPIIVVAFGYPANEPELEVKEIENYKRKALEDIIIGNYEEKFREIFNLVRVAPSAINLQPWRLYVNENSIDLYANKGNILTKGLSHFSELDSGIALKHLELGCKEKNITFEIKNQKLEDKKNLKYITSVML